MLRTLRAGHGVSHLPDDAGEKLFVVLLVVLLILGGGCHGDLLWVGLRVVQ
jgi:hypothetical protein